LTSTAKALVPPRGAAIAGVIFSILTTIGLGLVCEDAREPLAAMSDFA
jgi:hypothetical protein